MEVLGTQANLSHCSQDWTCERESLQKFPLLGAQMPPVFKPCWLARQTSRNREEPSCPIFSEFLIHRIPDPRSACCFWLPDLGWLVTQQQTAGPVTNTGPRSWGS